MKKIFTKNLFVYMLAAFIVTITAIFTLQTFISKSNNLTLSQNKLEDVKEKGPNSLEISGFVLIQ